MSAAWASGFTCSSALTDVAARIGATVAKHERTAEERHRVAKRRVHVERRLRQRETAAGMEERRADEPGPG